MTSLQAKLQQIGSALYGALGNIVHHYYRPDGEAQSVVWQEQGEYNSFHADNTKGEQAIRGTVDYYTKTEFDSNADVIQTVLMSLGAAWALESVQYEEDTKLIHYEWSWIICTDGVDVNG